jgi:glucokinase
MMESMNTLAIDIGGTKFTVAGFEGERLVLRETRLTDRTGGPEWMVSQLDQVVGSWRENHGFRPYRCGVGFGGPVDFSSQTVTLSTHVEGWKQYPLLKEIKRIADAPAIIDNDANVGALGEACYGAGQSSNPLFYMTLSTGIGGGIVIDGRIYRGADSFAGEIGHLNVVPDGPVCLCGSRGCLERMCCGLWLERDYARSARELFDDPDFVKHYVVLLVRGLKAAIMILNPAQIVIGGGISKAGKRLFMPLREELKHQITSWSRARLEVVPAQLQDDSVVYGAFALAKQNL